MRTCDLVAFSASSSARLAILFGASRTRWRSCIGGVIRLKLFRSTFVFWGSNSLETTVFHPSVYSFHPLFPCASGALLMYTHKLFSSSVYCVAISIFRAGVVTGI
jgi:hypothetical protein